MLTKITKHAEMVGFCQLFGFKTASIYFKETKGFFVFPLVIMSYYSCHCNPVLTYRSKRNTNMSSGPRAQKGSRKRGNSTKGEIITLINCVQ